MCLRPRIVYTVCSHSTELDQEDCTPVHIIKAAQQLGGFFLPDWMRSSCGPTWCRPICTTRVDYRLGYDFCPTCRAAYAGYGELTESTVLNYWAFKNSIGVAQPIDPVCVPPRTLFGPPTAITVDPRALRLETIALSEALHIWDSPDEFLSSTAYGSEDMLNLVEYLEKVRSATLHRARRVDFAPVPDSTFANGINANNGTEGTRSDPYSPPECASTAGVPAPMGFVSRSPNHHAEDALPIDLALCFPKLNGEVPTGEVETQRRTRLLKGKEKATDAPLPGEYYYSEPIACVSRGYEATRREGVNYVLGSMYLGETGPSGPFGPSRSLSSSKLASFEQTPQDPRNIGKMPEGSAVKDKVNAVVLVSETVSEAEDGGYPADWTAYSLDKCPGELPELIYEGGNDFDRQASSPRALPVSASSDTGFDHRSVVPSAADDPVRPPSNFAHQQWNSSRCNSAPVRENSLSYGAMPEINASLTDTSSARVYRQSDRPDSEDRPASYAQPSAETFSEFDPFTPLPLQGLACGQSESDTSRGKVLQPLVTGGDGFSPDSSCRLTRLQSESSESDGIDDVLSRFAAESDADFETYRANLLSRQPALSVSSGSLPDGLAAHMAHIDTLFPHQFVARSSAVDQSILPSSSYIPSSPLPASQHQNSSNRTIVFPSPYDRVQSTRAVPLPLTAGSIAAVAARSLGSSQLTRTSFAQPQPRAPARTGSPLLAKTPSVEIQSMYRNAIRQGGAVLHAPPPPTTRTTTTTMVDDVDERGGRRKSAVGLMRPVTPKMDADEEATWRGPPRSAPPFPGRARRPFEEVAVTAVCFCFETGRAECECPQVVEPAVWM